MKKLLKSCLVLFAVMLMPFAHADTKDSPLGYWKTIDDVTGKGKAILHIYEANGALYGKVVKTFPTPGEKEHPLCTSCDGERHNKPILGMVVLEGLKQDKDHSNEWNGGKIVDPLSGKIYRCTVTTTSNGQKLKVRGYIGISLFGRTQTWERSEGEV